MPTILADQLVRALRDQLGERPQLVGLLDALLSVASSSQPQLRLLTVLVGAAKPVNKTAAAHATKPRPTILEAPVIVVESTDRRAASPPAKTESKPVRKTVETPARKPKSRPANSEPFDWKKLVAYAREHFVALYSVLNKCDYALEDGTLTLYAVRKFNKTKLDEPKYLTQLHDALESVGQPGLAIVTLPTAKPPADAKLAKVAAMMGGGQEVSVEELGKE